MLKMTSAMIARTATALQQTAIHFQGEPDGYGLFGIGWFAFPHSGQYRSFGLISLPQLEQNITLFPFSAVLLLSEKRLMNRNEIKGETRFSR